MEGELLAQGLGFLSFALAVVMFNQKRDKHLKWYMLTFNLNHSLHFYLLDAKAGMISSLLSACRTALSIQFSGAAVAYPLIGLTFGFGVYHAENLLDLLPIMGTIVGTYALFMQQGIAMRYSFLLGASLWLANNIVVGSIGGIMLEVMAITSNLTTIYRLHHAPVK